MNKAWLLIGFISSLLMWILMLSTFAIAALNKGVVTITVNAYGEMPYEVVLLPAWFLLTIYAFWKGLHN